MPQTWCHSSQRQRWEALCGEGLGEQGCPARGQASLQAGVQFSVAATLTPTTTTFITRDSCHHTVIICCRYQTMATLYQTPHAKH